MLALPQADRAAAARVPARAGDRRRLSRGSPIGPARRAADRSRPPRELDLPPLPRHQVDRAASAHHAQPGRDPAAPALAVALVVTAPPPPAPPPPAPPRPDPRAAGGPRSRTGRRARRR